MTTENLRREARVEVRLPVVLLRGKSSSPLETADVSFKGLFVRTAEPPALRSLVRLKVALLDREFEAHAMVVHVNELGIGLQFWGLSGTNRTSWDAFVRGLVHAPRMAPKSGVRFVMTQASAPRALAT